jgi:hypothetical protein
MVLITFSELFVGVREKGAEKVCTDHHGKSLPKAL